MNYIRKHWRGELPLGVSFWVNVYLINVCLFVINYLLSERPPLQNPVVLLFIIITFLVVKLGLIVPWQFFGLWRSASRHSNEKGKKFWPVIAKIIVVLNLFSIIGTIQKELPVYRDMCMTVFDREEHADYSVVLTEDGSLIHLKGGLGLGVSKAVKRVIAKHPQVQGIILDSCGGRVHEGRELAKLIQFHNLDTYSLKGCYSACGTAFIAGKRRYLGQGARLGFHRYYLKHESLAPYADLTKEQKKDLKLFKQQGVSQNFIDKMFTEEDDSLWYPTVEELLAAGVVQKVINPSTLWALRINSSDTTASKKKVANYQRYADWESVSIPRVCEFQIPPSMELQAGVMKALKNKYNEKHLNSGNAKSSIVAQQKGLNDLEQDAMSKYARVIVKYQPDPDGEFGEMLRDPAIRDLEMIAFIDSALEASARQSATQAARAGMDMKIISWEGTEVVTVNGIDCLKTMYRRTVNQGAPVLVQEFKIPTNGQFLTVTVSYRIQEADYWANDLNKLINTFNFSQ